MRWHHQRFGRIVVVLQRVLIFRGADLEAKDPQGRTALTWCASSGKEHPEVKIVGKEHEAVRFGVLEDLCVGR